MKLFSDFLQDYGRVVYLVLAILISGGMRKLGWSIVKVAVVVVVCVPGVWVLFGAVLEAMLPALLVAFLAGLILGAVLLTRYVAKRWPERLAQAEFLIGLALATFALHLFMKSYESKADHGTYLMNGVLAGAMAVFELHKAYEKVYQDGSPAAAPLKPRPQPPKA